MKTLNLLFLVFTITVGCNKSNIDLYRIRIENKYGFIDNHGKICIYPKFSYVSDFSEGLAYARVDSIVGYINKKGRYEFSVILPKHENHILKTSLCYEPIKEINPFSLKGGWKLFDFSSNRPEEKDALFSQGLALFMDAKTSKYGYVNSKGRFIISPRFDNGGKFINNLACVLIGDRWGYINASGDFVIEPKFSNANDFSEGLASVYLERHIDSSFSTNCLIINTEGHIIKEPQGMITIHPFKEGYAVKCNLGKLLILNQGYTYIDKELNEQSENYFQAAEDFSEGYGAIKINDKWGFINSGFDNFLDIKFNNVQSFHEGLAPVKLYQKWGYINKFNEVVIDYKYDSCTVFRNGLAYVWINNNDFLVEGYIDKTGNLIWYKEKH